MDSTDPFTSGKDDEAPPAVPSTPPKPPRPPKQSKKEQLEITSAPSAATSTLLAHSRHLLEMNLESDPFSASFYQYLSHLQRKQMPCLMVSEDGLGAYS